MSEPGEWEGMVNSYVSAGLVMSICLALAACQTPQSRQAELATICANPFNRDPQSFYWAECQSISPSTDRQLQRDYVLGAPTGD